MDTETMTHIRKAVNEAIESNHGPVGAFLLSVIDENGEVNYIGHGNLRDIEKLLTRSKDGTTGPPAHLRTQ